MKTRAVKEVVDGVLRENRSFSKGEGGGRNGTELCM